MIVSADYTYPEARRWRQGPESTQSGLRRMCLAATASTGIPHRPDAQSKGVDSTGAATWRMFLGFRNERLARGHVTRPQGRYAAPRNSPMVRALAA